VRTIVVVLAGIVTLWTRSAAASCVSPTSIHPTEMTTDVPANTRVWIRDLGIGLGADPMDFSGASLWTADGVAVPTDVAIPHPHVVILTPRSNLEIGERYQVRIDSPAASVEDTWFTVTTDADLTPPDLPTLAVGEVLHERDSVSLPRIDGAELEVGGAETLVWLDVDGESDLDPTSYEGFVSDVFDPEIELAFVGTGCSTNWSEAEPGAQTTVRVATSDLGGNLSPWTDPELVDLACGCQTTPGVTPTVLGLILLPLLFTRRAAARPDRRSSRRSRRTGRSSRRRGPARIR
jgi:hypothetical protein